MNAQDDMHVNGEEETRLNHGQLGIVIWPVYLGVASSHANNGSVALAEPYGDINYQRGQITWTQRDGIILGKARVWVPAGVWTHFAFFSGWHQDALMGIKQMDHPVNFMEPGAVDVDPIANQDILGVRV